MGLRDKKPAYYNVDPRIMRKVDEAENRISRVIDDLVYDAYMQGRHDQAIADIFQCMRRWGKSFKDVHKAFCLFLPSDYEVPEAEVKDYAMSYMTGSYATQIICVRNLIQNMKIEFMEATKMLEIDEFLIKIYQAAEGVANDKLEQFVWTYLQKEKAPPLFLKEEST